MEIQCPKSPGKTYLNRLSLSYPTQLTIDKSIHHLYCCKPKRFKDLMRELGDSFKTKTVQVLNVAKMQKISTVINKHKNS